MFNFKKNKQGRYGAQNTEEYTPTVLPKNAEKGHSDLSTFITGDYTMQDAHYIEECHKVCEDKLAELVKTGDCHTVGSVCDAHIDAQGAFLKTKHLHEVAMHELSGQNINKTRQVRKEELTRKIPESEARIDELKRQIEPLEDKRAQFQWKIGKCRIPIGVPVTIAAMVVDAFVNKSYLESVLLQSMVLLIITVVCMSVMSDGSMWVLGTLLSRQDEDFMDKRLYRASVGGLIAMFLLSVVAGVMIRFGSMDSIFGTINAAGQFVGKDSYSMAEWGVCLATAFVTTATGLISLVFSVDRNAHLEKRREVLEAELAKETACYNSWVNELSALEKAPDPMIRDCAVRKAAEANIENLIQSLKLDMRRLLALEQKNAAYTDAMTESAEMLLKEEPSPAEDAAKQYTTPYYIDTERKEAV